MGSFFRTRRKHLSSFINTAAYFVRSGGQPRAIEDAAANRRLENFLSEWPIHEYK
jgi:hypothetical protein